MRRDEASSDPSFSSAPRNLRLSRRVTVWAGFQRARHPSLFLRTLHRFENYAHQRRRRASTVTFTEISLSSRLISKVTSSPGLASVTRSKKESESLIS